MSISLNSTTNYAVIFDPNDNVAITNKHFTVVVCAFGGTLDTYPVYTSITFKVLNETTVIPFTYTTNKLIPNPASPTSSETKIGVARIYVTWHKQLNN